MTATPPRKAVTTITIGALALVSMLMFATGVTRAAVIIGGGASLYTDVLSGATMSGEIGGSGTPSIGSVSSISNPSTEFNYDNVVRYDGTPTTSSITATLSSSATVGTIISVLNYPGPATTHFSNGPDWAFSVNGSPPVDNSTWPLNSPTGDFGGVQITTLSSPQSATSVAMSLSNLPTYFTQPSSTHFADYHYLVALPDSVLPVTTLSATSSTPGSDSFLPGNTIVYATDPSEALNTSFYSPDTDSFLQIDLGGTKTLSGLLLATYPGGGVADMIITDDLGHIVGTVTGASGSALLLPIKFDSPVTTSFLRFEPVAGPGLLALNEVIPLETLVTPEPASLGLLAAGGVLLLRRRRA